VFVELLALADSDASDGRCVVCEIDKDVGRMMPLNMFFGGDGVGNCAACVLIAYSRVGACYVATTHPLFCMGILTLCYH
jgi:hypothetical protein